MSKVVESWVLANRRSARAFAAIEKADLRRRINDAVSRVTAARERQRLEAEAIKLASSTIQSFKVQPEPTLSEEHARQYERFTGVPYDPEASARAHAWAAFNRWHMALKCIRREGHQTDSKSPR